MGFRFWVVFYLSVALLLFGCLADSEIQEQNSTREQPQENSSEASLEPIQNLTGNDSTEPEKYDFSQAYNEEGNLIVYFFHMPQCNACKMIRPEVEDIGYRYQNWTEWRGFNINIEEDRKVYLQFYSDFNLTPERSGTPMILVNNTILWGMYEINDSLEDMINGSVIR